MAMWLAALEAEDGSWSDDPLATEGDKDMAVSDTRKTIDINYLKRI